MDKISAVVTWSTGLFPIFGWAYVSRVLPPLGGVFAVAPGGAPVVYHPLGSFGEGRYSGPEGQLPGPAFFQDRVEAVADGPGVGRSPVPGLDQGDG